MKQMVFGAFPNKFLHFLFFGHSLIFPPPLALWLLQISGLGFAENPKYCIMSVGLFIQQHICQNLQPKHENMSAEWTVLVHINHGYMFV